ncbi:MAG: DUF4276 family protein [Clostridiales bacterium]|nr:DUF4276 family protein [Clostridiales bacterium]
MVKTVKLFVEGGGDSNSLRTECRAAFTAFLQKAGLSGHMPRIVASGSRKSAYDDFCTAIKSGTEAVLLVDSETAVVTPPGDTDYNVYDYRTWKPWYHLQNRTGQNGTVTDNWDKPSDTPDSDCHLMVESMETWFLADIAAVKGFYGQRFRESSLPSREDIENIEKNNVMDALEAATSTTSKGCYDKGNHSFKLLAIIDPAKVIRSSPWAKRFVELLTEKMQEEP